MQTSQCLLTGCLVLIGAALAEAQVSFRQGSFDAAIPSFGGYDPGTAGRATFSTRNRNFRFRQGSFDGALPPFGGYTPGSGGRLNFSTRGPATFRQGSSPVTLPPFGGFDPNTVARLQAGKQVADQQPAAAGDEGVDANVANDRDQTADAGAEVNLPALGLLNRTRPGAGNNAVRVPMPIRRAAVPVDVPLRSDPPKADARNSRRQKAIAKLIQKAEAAEAASRIGQAKMFYRMAIKRAPEDSRQALVERLQRLE